jgi:hypothetical protein
MMILAQEYDDFSGVFGLLTSSVWALRPVSMVVSW